MGKAIYLPLSYPGHCAIAHHWDLVGLRATRCRLASDYASEPGVWGSPFFARDSTENALCSIAHQGKSI